MMARIRRDPRSSAPGGFTRDDRADRIVAFGGRSDDRSFYRIPMCLKS